MSLPSIDRWQEILEVFEVVADVAAGEREQLLAERCAGDEELEAEVRSLLAADETSPDLFLEDAELGDYIAESADHGSVGLRPGGRFAGFTVLELVAEGGMGSVYRARQDNPEREVALKVLRPGMAGEVLVQRFQREVAVLARLQHKGIATLYEAGVEDGMPWFAMEFVDGELLGEAAGPLDRRARLALVLKICEALSAAHAQGIVHRDLKPANVMVDAHGEPRLLDFGVARLSGQELPAATLATSPGQILGTVAYMSPEQAAGTTETLDARADVYSLGVILYELLAGRRPLPLDQRPVHEALAVLAEQDPTLLGDLDPTLRGDLETITAKALEKQPVRRYPSVDALADRPIAARPPSTLYQLRKFARRHRVLVSGVTATLVSLAVGLGLAVRYAWIADEQRGLAELQSYRLSIQAALAAADEGDAPAARALLAETPAGRRGFEHDHVAARLDTAVAGLTGDWRPVAWMPDDERLLVVSPSGLLLWRPFTAGSQADSAGTAPTDPAPPPTWPLPAAPGPVALSGDGRWVAAAVGSTLHTWDTETLHPSAPLELPHAPRQLLFRPGTHELFVDLSDGALHIDVGAGELLARWYASATATSALAVSDDGCRLARRAGIELVVWDVPRGVVERRWTGLGSLGVLNSLRTRFRPGTAIVSSRVSFAKVDDFDVVTGRRYPALSLPAEGIGEWVDDPQLRRRLAAARANGSVRLFEDGDPRSAGTWMHTAEVPHSLTASPGTRGHAGSRWACDTMSAWPWGRTPSGAPSPVTAGGSRP